MPALRALRIYLDDIPLQRAQRGNFNLINRIRGAFESRNFSVELRRNSAAERLRSAAFPGYSLFHMDDPFHARALTLRRAYYYPFWRIEKSAKRWEWDVARDSFYPDTINGEAARKFCAAWRKRLYNMADAPIEGKNMVYVPLQGRLLTRRSFQAQSPLDMLSTLIAHEPDRQIFTSFHPGEAYADEERDAIADLVKRAPNLRVVSDPMETLLANCDYVATENSSVALAGFFFRKPAVLFARIDFHHIAANVETLGAEVAIRSAPGLSPDYDRYIYWFLQLTAINAGTESAEAQILAASRRHGWPV